MMTHEPQPQPRAFPELDETSEDKPQLNRRQRLAGENRQATRYRKAMNRRGYLASKPRGPLPVAPSAAPY
ncbi:MAG: hypothetical protein M3P94_01455 [Chloroflexota bacterium]|nr:hypothetical protein [Chloroflexota bacterium]